VAWVCCWSSSLFWVILSESYSFPTSSKTIISKYPIRGPQICQPWSGNTMNCACACGTGIRFSMDWTTISFLSYRQKTYRCFSEQSCLSFWCGQISGLGTPFWFSQIENQEAHAQLMQILLLSVTLVIQKWFLVSMVSWQQKWMLGELKIVWKCESQASSLP